MQSIFNKHLIWGLLAVLCLPLVSCEEDEMAEPDQGYEIPEIYDFANVDYTGQTQRLSMLAELDSYMGTSAEGANLSAGRLKAMFANNAAEANWDKSYLESKQLKNKTFEQQQAVFEQLMEDFAEASQSTKSGSEGQSGIVVSNDGNKQYLLGANGLDYHQIIEKGLMGATLYYQATAVYMGEDRMNVDNEMVEPGQGTEMEHHWDEAFGYLGVPIDFPNNTSGLLYWGDYSNKRNGILGSNEKIMDAMLKGRAAISNNDLETRDEAIAEARAIWEDISVGSALYYLNSSIDNFDDTAIFAHGLSEGIGFVYSLQFNPAKRVTNAQVAELLELMGGASNFADMNLYQVTLEDLQTAKDLLAGYYGMEDVKDEF